MLLLFVSLFAAFVPEIYGEGYEPNWNSLDKRPLPAWYDEGKFGIFTHWGVYSVPAFRSEWMWYYWKDQHDVAVCDFMKNNYKPGFTYADFAPLFTAEYFDANKFREIVEQSGARYFVFTSKHHEGFTMWPSNTSWNWNAVDTGPHRDIVGELKKAFATSPVHFGLYFSQFEWFNRLYINDHANNRTDYVEQVSYPQMLDIVHAYRPDIIWSDGDWEDSDTYWRSTKFLAWLYNESPVKSSIVVNDRWGQGTTGKHGGFLTFSDHFDPGHLVPRKWENAMTLDTGSWGYRRAMRVEDIHTVHDLIEQLARTIACGGNMLLNVGPDNHGIIVPIFVERLRQLGDWIRVNSEAIYATKPWIYQNDSNIWYTSRVRSPDALRQRTQPVVYNRQDIDETIVYAFILEWPLDNKALLPSVKINGKSTARMLGVDAAVSMRQSTRGTIVDLSAIEFRRLKSYDAWVIKFEHLNSENRNPIAVLQRQGILDRFGNPTNPPRHRRRHRRKRDTPCGDNEEEGEGENIRMANEKLLDRLSEMFENEF